MTLRSFLVLNAVLFVPFGILMILVPGTLFPMFGIDLDADGILMARVFGSALMNFGLICYWIKGENPASTGMKSVLLGNLIFHAIDTGSTFVATTSGVMNSLGWMFSALHFLLAIGFAYYLFTKPKS